MLTDARSAARGGVDAVRAVRGDTAGTREARAWRRRRGARRRSSDWSTRPTGSAMQESCSRSRSTRARGDRRRRRRRAGSRCSNDAARRGRRRGGDARRSSRPRARRCLMALGRNEEARACFEEALAGARQQSLLYEQLLILRERASSPGRSGRRHRAPRSCARPNASLELLGLGDGLGTCSSSRRGPSRRTRGDFRRCVDGELRRRIEAGRLARGRDTATPLGKY